MKLHTHRTSVAQFLVCIIVESHSCTTSAEFFRSPLEDSLGSFKVEHGGAESWNSCNTNLDHRNGENITEDVEWTKMGYAVAASNRGRSC
jgi:hypothetical protein